MGRGDIKTKKGKIARGSFGNTRLKRPAAAEVAAPVAKAEKEAKPKKAKK